MRTLKKTEERIGEITKKEFEELKKKHNKLRKSVDDLAKLFREIITTLRREKAFGSDVTTQRLTSHYLKIGRILNEIWGIKD